MSEAPDCAHHWVAVDIASVERNGVVGLAITNECAWCKSVFYEPSNVDRFPETAGVDPRPL